MASVLTGKVALVTGASRGIGKVIATQLAQDGAKVAVTARTETPTEENPGSIHETVDLIKSAGREGIALKLDVTDDEAVSATVSSVIAEYGGIDILVNNAGALGGGASFLEGEPELLDHFYRTNVRAPYLLTQVVAREMVARGGGVVFNVSSGLARLPHAGTVRRGGGMGARGPGTVYGMSKAALDRFTAGVAPELAEQNIAIISIYPGFTLTERISRMLPPGADISRMEKPETTAKAISYLCLDPMQYSGQTVVARELAAQYDL